MGDTYEEEENNGVEVESIQNGVDLNTADSALKDQVRTKWKPNHEQYQNHFFSHTKNEK